MPTLADYESTFKSKTHVNFTQESDDVVLLHIQNSAAQARVSLYAAHVISYIPTHADDALWLSKSSNYAKGQAIRGGIPLCWPWFGPAKEEGQPAHGFARLINWELSSITEVNDSQTDITLTLSDNQETRRYWPHAFELEYHISIADKLTCHLRTRNTDTKSFKISQALHSYFACDATETLITGLENTSFTSDMHQGILSSTEAIRYDGEIDRVYHDTAATCIIEDSSAKRAIHIAKEQSETTVIWNPGPGIAQAKADFDDDGYKNMFCVETCNVDADTREIEPGAEHTVTTIISLKPL